MILPFLASNVFRRSNQSLARSLELTEGLSGTVSTGTGEAPSSEPPPVSGTDGADGARGKWGWPRVFPCSSVLPKAMHQTCSRWQGLMLLQERRSPGRRKRSFSYAFAGRGATVGLGSDGSGQTGDTVFSRKAAFPELGQGRIQSDHRRVGLFQARSFASS